jgi:hypothetical protein
VNPVGENRLLIPAQPHRGKSPSQFSSRVRLAAACLLLMSSVACGEALRLGMPSGYLSIGFTGGDGRPIEVISPFEDGRQKPTCSKGPEDLEAEDAVYTSLHNRLGCSSSPLEWIAERLAQGLESAGFDVLTHAERSALDPEEDEDVITVEGRMDMLEVEVLPQMQTVFAEADLQVEIFVSAHSGLRASRRFHVKSQDAGLAVGTETHQRVFDEMADRAVRDMTAAILSLLNRFPESGRAASTEESEP